MRKKIFAVFICFSIAMAALAGCGSALSPSPSGSSDQNIFGQVTAIDGSSITLALISTPGGGAYGSYPSGGRPSGERPQGSFQPGASGNGWYNGGPYPSGGVRGGMELSGETKTVIVTDGTIITTGMGMGQQDTSPAAASLSDITVGSYLSITMSGDAVVSITILQFEYRDGNAGASPSPDVIPSPSPSPVASASPGTSAEPGLGIKIG